MTTTLKNLTFVILSIVFIGLQSCKNEFAEMGEDPVVIQQRVDKYPKMDITKEQAYADGDNAKLNGLIYKVVKESGSQQVGEEETYEFYCAVKLEDKEGNTTLAYYAWKIECRYSIALSKGDSYYMILEDDGFSGAKRIIAAEYVIPE